MNKEEFAEILRSKRETIAQALKNIRGGRELTDCPLTGYVVDSIETGRSSYPVANLLSYCKGLGVQVKINDWATDKDIQVSSVIEVHKVLNMLMERYKVDYKLVYRETGLYYTAPKTFDEEELERARTAGKDKKFLAPLSVNTLLGICFVIHSELKFVYPSDESSVITIKFYD